MEILHAILTTVIHRPSNARLYYIKPSKSAIQALKRKYFSTEAKYNGRPCEQALLGICARPNI